MMARRFRFLAALLALMLSVSGASASTEDPAFSPNPHPHSAAVDWVDGMLLAIEHNPPFPTATTWRMFVVLTSMYDAWAAYDEIALGVTSGDDLQRPAAEHTLENKERAVSYAAHNALSHVFPGEVEIFDAILATQGLGLSASLDPSRPDGIGNLAAAAVIRARSVDGASAYDFEDVASSLFPRHYRPTSNSDPNRWVPLHVPTGTQTDGRGLPTWSADEPSSYEVQSFLTPHWGSVAPFALESGDQLRPPAPPQLGSAAPYADARGITSTGDEAFRSQAREVLDFSGDLTDERKVIAEFWADGPHTWTPPGHWIQLAIGVSLRDGHGIDEDVCMYLALAGALLDAGIAAWDAKRAHDYVRPATAIPYLYGGETVSAWGGPNQGTQRIDGADWQPYQSATFVTPPFAEYVSGHSAFSAAAAEVLTGYTASELMFDGETRLGRDYDGDGVEDLFGQHVAAPGTLLFEAGPPSMIVLRWPTFREAADEAGISRLYGGIHFQDGDLRGRALGRAIGQRALEHARAHWQGTAS